MKLQKLEMPAQMSFHALSGFNEFNHFTIGTAYYMKDCIYINPMFPWELLQSVLLYSSLQPNNDTSVCGGCDIICSYFVWVFWVCEGCLENFPLRLLLFFFMLCCFCVTDEFRRCAAHNNNTLNRRELVVLQNKKLDLISGLSLWEQFLPKTAAALTSVDFFTSAHTHHLRWEEPLWSACECLTTTVMKHFVFCEQFCAAKYEGEGAETTRWQRRQDFWQKSWNDLTPFLHRDNFLNPLKSF